MKKIFSALVFLFAISAFVSAQTAPTPPKNVQNATPAVSAVDMQKEQPSSTDQKENTVTPANNDTPVAIPATTDKKACKSFSFGVSAKKDEVIPATDPKK